MKTIFTLLLFAIVAKKSFAQVVLNELYTDPGAGKHEFFEIYNNSSSGAPFSANNLTMVTYYHNGTTKGFYVMDLPDMNITPRGYFVGAAASPFNYQGTLNSNKVDFNWNSAGFTANQGFIKEWVLGTANLADGNLNYDQVAVPANFNDFFYRVTGTGASYSVFLYNNGQLINTFLGGTGGMSTVTNEIVNMPTLYVDMSGSSPDFTINFSGYNNLPVESCTNDAGSDNGYIRQFDGACGSWVKSSASVQHTPRASNGTLIGIASGSVSVSVSTWMGNATTGSVVNMNVVSAPSSYFPIDLQVYTDIGYNTGKLDTTDGYIATNRENVISDGPFYTHFTPYDANILIAVKTNTGCYDKILFIPNVIVLSSKLISFTGNRLSNEIRFGWDMENNEQADKFELERSIDGVSFSSIGVIFASERSGSEHYEFRERDVRTNAIYRIRIFNKSGKVEYSNILRFTTEQKEDKTLRLLNNPVLSTLNFKYNSSLNGTANVQVMDMSGRIMLQQSFSISTGNNLVSLTLPSNLNKGTYILNVQQGNERKTSKFIHQ